MFYPSKSRNINAVFFPDTSLWICDVDPLIDPTRRNFSISYLHS
jgi:hypothetical protein